MFLNCLCCSHCFSAVSKYKPLMKDFPINDLITAAEIEKLTEAIVKVFQHLKKNKNVDYPIPRYLRLVHESITIIDIHFKGF